MKESIDIPRKKRKSAAKTNEGLASNTGAAVIEPLVDAPKSEDPSITKRVTASKKRVNTTASTQSATLAKNPEEAIPKTRQKKEITEYSDLPSSRKNKATATTTLSPMAQLPDQETINKMVEEAAYYLAEKRNFTPGFEQQDWLAAREQIMARINDAVGQESGTH